MAFRLQLFSVVPKTIAQNVIPKIPSPIMTNTFRTFQPSFVSPFQLCAVPKSRTSPRRKKLRAQGRWFREAHKLYKPYQICLECRRAMRPGTICTVNKDCMNQPRF